MPSVRRVERATGAPVSSANRGAPSAWSGWPWVSSVRATRRPRPRRRRAPAAGAPRRSGPGSTTTRSLRARLGQHPGVGAVQRHRARVGRQHAGRPGLARRRPGPARPPVTAPGARAAVPTSRVADPGRRVGVTEGGRATSPGDGRGIAEAARRHLRRAREQGPRSGPAASIAVGRAAHGVPGSGPPRRRHIASVRRPRRSGRPSATWPAGMQRRRRTGCRSGGARTRGVTQCARRRAGRTAAPGRRRISTGRSERLPGERALAPACHSVAAGVGHDRVGVRPGEQDAALLERLAHGGDDQRAGRVLVDSPARPPSGPAAGRPNGRCEVGVAGVDAAAGEDIIPAANCHRGDAGA